MHIRYDQEKDELLRRTRNIGFEDVKDAIADWNFYIKPNPSAWREHQDMIIFLYNSYPHCCPFVYEEWGIFLKTIFPARKYLPLFAKKKENDN